MPKPFTPAEQAEILQLRKDEVTFRDISLILKRRKQDTIDEWHRLTGKPKPTPIKVRYARDPAPMAYSQYRKMRTKEYPTWLWYVLYTGEWAKVSDPKHRVIVTAGSRSARKLNYPTMYAESKKNSHDRAMYLLHDSDIFLYRFISAKVTRIRQMTRP